MRWPWQREVHYGSLRFVPSGVGTAGILTDTAPFADGYNLDAPRPWTGRRLEVISFDSLGMKPEELTSTLNRLGGQGWSLIAIRTFTPTSGRVSEEHCIMQREAMQ